MPNARALKGSITVEGRSKSRSLLLGDAQLFVETHEVYGTTIGKLLDNLVEASVILASNAFMWALLNKSAAYVPTHDKWNVKVAFPAVISSHEDDSPENHLTCQGTLINFDSIVKYAVKVRTDQITQATFNLILAKIDEPSAIIEELRFSLNNLPSSHAESFHALTQGGYAGAELDLILAVAEKEGRIQEYNTQNTLMDGFPQREFLPQSKFQENIFI